MSVFSEFEPKADKWTAGGGKTARMADSRRQRPRGCGVCFCFLLYCNPTYEISVHMQKLRRLQDSSFLSLFNREICKMFLTSSSLVASFTKAKWVHIFHFAVAVMLSSKTSHVIYKYWWCHFVLMLWFCQWAIRSRCQNCGRWSSKPNFRPDGGSAVDQTNS